MTLLKKYPLYLGNEAMETKETITVTDKYTLKNITEVSSASLEECKKAVELGLSALKPMRELQAFERKAILGHCIQRIKERAQELTEVLCIEGGKPLKDSKTEVDRLISTLSVSAEEATRMVGEVMPLDIIARGKGYYGFWKRVPIGLCLFITPFNFPLNLVAHKIGPAIACGCPFILKPANNTPISALILGEILAETNLPKGAFSILPCQNEVAEELAKDPEIKLLSFTGSAKVGWDLKSKVGKKQVILELGGNAACIVDENVDIDDVVERLANGGYYQSGQSCISVQRIFVHGSIYDSVKEKLIAKVKSLKSGNPLDKDTFIGPLIDEKAAIRVEEWIQSAVKAGATLLCGGKRNGVMVEPSLLENVPHSEKLSCEEAFGPVAILNRFQDFEKVLEEVNDSRFGLQAGVFTRDLFKAKMAWERLEVGGVIINDTSAFRSDNMPYGGVKDSGLGREGVRFAIDHLTEKRMVVFRG